MIPEVKKLLVEINNPYELISLEEFSSFKTLPFLHLQILIGTKNKSSSEVFYCDFYSEKHLVELAINNKEWPKVGKGVVFVKEITKRFVTNYINEILTKCEGKSWLEIAHNLNQYFGWEFEDYDFEKQKWKLDD